MNSQKSYPLNFGIQLQNYQTTAPRSSFGNPLTFRSLRPSSVCYPESEEYTKSFKPRMTQMPFYNFCQPIRKQSRESKQGMNKKKAETIHNCYSQYETSFSTNTKHDSEKDVQFPYTLKQLQQKIFQEILLLRQSKLTLMEQYNDICQNKYKLQRQIGRLKKQNQAKNQFALSNENQEHIQQQEQQQKFDKIIQKKRNELIQIQFNFSQQELKLLEKIQNIRDTNNFITNQLIATSKNCKCVSFQTQQSQHVMDNAYKFLPSNDIIILQNLRQRKQKLLKVLVSHTNISETRTMLVSAIQSNQKLQQVLDLYLNEKKDRVKILKQKVKEQQQAKRQLFAELVKIKADIKGIKCQNQQIRKGLKMFSYI